VSVLDLGSNTFNLLIAAIEADRWTTLYETKTAVKFGRVGNAKDPQEKADALALGKKVLAEYHGTIRSFACTHHHAYGTESFRNFKESEDFLQEFEANYSYPITIISGEEEADYIFHGVHRTLPKDLESYIIMDIGGGSVEFILVEKGDIYNKLSFPIGAIPMHKQVLSKENYSIDDYTHWDRSLAPFIDELKQQSQALSTTTLIGSSGSFDTFYDVLNYPQQNKDGVHRFRFSELNKLLCELPQMDYTSRRAIKGMIPFRAEYIGYAAYLTQTVLRALSITTIYQSSHSLKEGVIAKHYYGKHTHH